VIGLATVQIDELKECFIYWLLKLSGAFIQMKALEEIVAEKWYHLLKV